MYAQQIFTSAKENTKYAYAVGRIRALETRFLDRTGITRLLEAESPSEVLKLLSEGEYESSLSGIQDATDFEMALNIERERIYSLIDDLSLDMELTQIFRIRWDFHNLKTLLKASYVGMSISDIGDILVISGLVPVENMRILVNPDEEGSKGEMPEYIADALADARSQYEESQNPQTIDIVIDNHLQEFIYQRLLDYPNPFLQSYFEAIVDLTNIKSFIRIKMLEENVRMLDMVLLPHGSLGNEFYMSQFEETVENLAAMLANTPYAEVISEGLRRWSEDHSLSTYERLLDNYLVNYIKAAKYIIFGVEPLIGYLLAKEHEMKLIRIIVIGKLNDLPADNIRERLRDTYV